MHKNIYVFRFYHKGLAYSHMIGILMTGTVSFFVVALLRQNLGVVRLLWIYKSQIN